MTGNEETQDAEERETEPEYLREAVRLAELRMTEQNLLQTEYERKAVLLITFCVVVVGYLLAGDWGGWTAALKVAAFGCLIVAAAKGIRIFEFAQFGVQGVHPRTLAAPSLFGGKADALRRYVCGLYAERIDRNHALLNSRVRLLESAKKYFYAGLAGAVAVVFLEKAMQILA